jgi:hypothetical protein
MAATLKRSSLLARSCARHDSGRRGKIVNIGSNFGVGSFQNALVCAAAKARPGTETNERSSTLAGQPAANAC